MTLESNITRWLDATEKTTMTFAPFVGRGAVLDFTNKSEMFLSCAAIRLNRTVLLNMSGPTTATLDIMDEMAEIILGHGWTISRVRSARMTDIRANFTQGSFLPRDFTALRKALGTNGWLLPQPHKSDDDITALRIANVLRFHGEMTHAVLRRSAVGDAKLFRNPEDATADFLSRSAPDLAMVEL